MSVWAILPKILYTPFRSFYILPQLWEDFLIQQKGPAMQVLLCLLD